MCVAFQQHSVFDDCNGSSPSYIPRNAERRFRGCFKISYIVIRRSILVRYSEQDWAIYPVWSTLSKALVAAPHHVSLAFYQMSRAAQASGSAGSITRIPGVVASNVAMYSINLMSDSWPEVLTATHRVFDQ